MPTLSATKILRTPPPPPVSLMCTLYIVRLQLKGFNPLQKMTHCDVSYKVLPFTIAGSCYDSTISFSDTLGDGSTDPSLPAVDAVLNNNNKAWCTTASPPDAYLQVDFGDLYAVCAVAVQGLFDGINDVYPTSFKLSFAYDDIAHEWADMYEEDGSVRVRFISCDSYYSHKYKLNDNSGRYYRHSYSPFPSFHSQFLIHIFIHHLPDLPLFIPQSTPSHFKLPAVMMQ